MKFCELTGFVAIGAVFVFLPSSVECKRRGVVTTQITDIKCENPLSKTAVNTNCSLKSYSRTNTVVNFETFLIRSVISDNLKFRLTIYYRVRNKYQQFLGHTVEDTCGLVGGGQNIFMDRFFLDPVRLAAPELVHPCPYVFYKYC